MIILNKQLKTPYYIQLANAYENLIKSGYFSHGEKLSTLTEIKEMFNVSLKVAAQTYDRLSTRKLIYSKRGKGFFVSYHNAIRFDLNLFYNIESQLLNENGMNKHHILFEKVEVMGYVANQLSLEDGDFCYHIKQCYGKENKNVLMQEIYLPLEAFPKLNKVYQKYLTIPSLLQEGYEFKLKRFSSRYFSTQATIEHEVILKLQKNDPLWRVESTYYLEDETPIALVNHYLSGEHVTMAVMLDAN